jgi:hypothetical protein
MDIENILKISQLMRFIIQNANNLNRALNKTLSKEVEQETIPLAQKPTNN